MKLKELITEHIEKEYPETTLSELLEREVETLTETELNRIVLLLYGVCSRLEDLESDIYAQLVQLYGGTYDEWVQVDYDLDSKTGTDFWCENCRTGQLIYVNLNADGNYTFSEEF